MVLSIKKFGLCAFLAACLLGPGLSLDCESIGVASSSFVCPPQELSCVPKAVTALSMIQAPELMNQTPVQPVPVSEDWLISSALSATPASALSYSSVDLVACLGLFQVIIWILITSSHFGWCRCIIPTMFEITKVVRVVLLEPSMHSRLGVWSLFTTNQMLLSFAWKYFGYFNWVKNLSYECNRGDPRPFIELLWYYLMLVVMNLHACSFAEQIHPPEKLTVRTEDAILVYLMGSVTVLMFFFVLIFGNKLRARTTFLRDKIVNFRENKSDAVMLVGCLVCSVVGNTAYLWDKIVQHLEKRVDVIMLVAGLTIMVVACLLGWVASWSSGNDTDSDKEPIPRRRRRRQRHSKLKMKRSRSAGVSHKEWRRRPSLRRRIYRARRIRKDSEELRRRHMLSWLSAQEKEQEALRLIDTIVSIVGTCLGLLFTGNIFLLHDALIVLLFWGPAIVNAGAPHIAAIISRVYTLCQKSVLSERPDAVPGEDSSQGPAKTPSSGPSKNPTERHDVMPPADPGETPPPLEVPNSSLSEDEYGDDYDDNDDDGDGGGKVQTVSNKTDREFRETFLRPECNKLPSGGEWIEPSGYEEDSGSSPHMNFIFVETPNVMPFKDSTKTLLNDPSNGKCDSDEDSPPSQCIFVEPPMGKRMMVKFHSLKRISEIKDEISEICGMCQCSFYLRIVGGCKRLDKTHLTLHDCGVDENMALAMESNYSQLLGGNDDDKQRADLANSLLDLAKAHVGPRHGLSATAERSSGQQTPALAHASQSRPVSSLFATDHDDSASALRTMPSYSLELSPDDSIQGTFSLFTGKESTNSSSHQASPAIFSFSQLFADTRKEAALKRKCEQNGAEYIEPSTNETPDSKQARWKEMDNDIRKKKRSIIGTKRMKRRRDKSVTKRQKRDADRVRKQIVRDEEDEETKRKKRDADRIRKQRERANEISVLKSCCAEEVPKIQVEPHKTAIRKGISAATRTHRCDGSHQASVCVICDRCIIGTETIHRMTKERILLNQKRLSVKTYEEFYGEELNPILVDQYSIDDMPGILLSPRSYRDGDTFEACSECFDSLKPYMAKKNKKPPKHAIANGFAIGHIPSVLMIPGEDGPRRINLKDGDISEIMCAAVARQRPYGFIFAFTGGSHQSVMGQFSFFEMDQTHIGGVINHYRLTGANDHILCALCGRFTPSQRVIAQKRARLDTSLYVDLMTWFIRASNHYAFADVTPPEDCPQPRMLQDKEANENNTDESQNPGVEDEYGGGTFTFTSSHDPSENTGVYRNSTDFTMAILNRTSPMLLAYGGKYVSSGRELRLESVFPVQFPFGLGGPTARRPTQISEVECLKHYLRLSLPQFMRGDFLLVVLHMYNRIVSYKTGLIMCRTPRLHGKSFAELISTLTEAQIKAAADRISHGHEDTSVAAEFLRKAETSCKAIGYTAAAARANRRLMYSLCDRFGIPHIFFTLTPDDECSFRVRLSAYAGEKHDLPNFDMSDEECWEEFVLRRDTRSKYPGACALEYESIVHVLLEVLFGWDSKQQRGKKGIFGSLLAYAVAHEEQGRFLFWFWLSL